MKRTSMLVAQAFLGCALALVAGHARAQQHGIGGGNPVALRDRLGNPIAVGSTTPYSPEQTCGECHDFAKITEGYHFQQGKGYSNSSIYVSDDYNLAKPWLLSDGMYGKW